MRKLFLTTFFLFGLFIVPLFPQEFEGISGNYTFNITKTTIPPALSVVEGSLNFSDSNGNLLFEASEEGIISFTIANNGKGESVDITGTITLKNAEGLTCPSFIKIDYLPPGKQENVKIPVSGTKLLTDGNASIRVDFIDANDFGCPPVEISIPTQSFKPPLLTIDDKYGYKFTTETGGQAKAGSVITLTTRIQNTGTGNAEDVNVNFRIPELTFISSEDNVSLGTLKSGEYKDVVFMFGANMKYTDPQIHVNVDITEKNGNYGFSKVFSVELNTNLEATNKVVIQSLSAPASGNIQAAPSLTSDVDINIPGTGINNPNAFAVVIGNRDYKYVKSVDFAVNDSKSVKNYLINTLGYKEGNIYYEENASKSKMELLFGTKDNPQGKLYNSIKAGISDVFIYYSGHGAPGIKDHKSYFAPVDCDPGYIEMTGYQLKIFYDNLSKLNAKSITVVIDACFSGAEILKDISPIVIEDEDENPVNLPNTVIFASSKSNQVSSWYREKQHGLFTYFFLKALQNNEYADINHDQILTAKEVFLYLSHENEGVPYYARFINGVEQIPSFQGNNPEQIIIKWK